jgi:hypothetical protein
MDSINAEEQQVLDEDQEDDNEGGDQREDDYQSSYIMGRVIRDESSLGTGMYIENSDGGYTKNKQQ